MSGGGSPTCVLLQGVFDGNEVLQRFGHLAAGNGQVPGVQEVTHPAVVLKESLDHRDSGETRAPPSGQLSKCSPLPPHLGLGQLVVVVGETQVEASAVDVHGLAQDGARHGRTLDVPPWSPLKTRQQQRRSTTGNPPPPYPPPTQPVRSRDRGLTFPHGESHDGSPGLDAFHKAKSLGDFFSLNLSAEMLRSPEEKSTQLPSPQRPLETPEPTGSSAWLVFFCQLQASLNCCLILLVTFSFLQGLLITDRLRHQFGVRVLWAAIEFRRVEVDRTVGLIPANTAAPTHC